MRKSMQKTITTAVYALCLLLASCGKQSTAEVPETETVTESIEETINEESVKEDTSETKSDAPVKETVIDFPFSHDMEEGRNDRYPFYQSSDPDTTIPVWVSQTKSAEDNATEGGDQSSFELVQNTVFGNTGHMSEYEDRKTFLSDFGFGGQEPFYCYYDRNGNLQLELYLDEESGRGCGLIHRYGDTYQMEKEDSMYGFAFDTVSDGTWREEDPYLFASIDGETGENSVEDYEEIIDYTETGKVDCYQSFGSIDWLHDEGEMPDEKSTILKINYIYRDDGSLFYRDYHHNDQVFGTTYQSLDSYYDESERIVYETAYITHGSLEYYYIYDDAGREPAYALFLDDNLGYCMPECVRFH